MPNARPHPAALRLPCGPFSPAPPGGRLPGLVLTALGLALLGLAIAPTLAGAQGFGGGGARDPGVRGGPPGAGQMLPGLGAAEQSFFNAGLEAFEDVNSVTGSIPNTEGGLGPRFNLDSCGGCHAQPAVGGTSPAVNPQVAVATKQGAGNKVPFFITTSGPVREARFQRNPDGSRDGGVHGLFVISGRSDAPGCSITQPDFDRAAAERNLIFRIPTPTFGAGLIQSISDSEIMRNKNSNTSAKRALGISGKENREGNAGTITRFGWKAQNKSLQLFGGEAYNVEQGVTNELFEQERDGTEGCQFNTLPEDETTFNPTTGESELNDVVLFAAFMRFLAPPTPANPTSSTIDGEQQFNNVGCNLCHTKTLTTGNTGTNALNRKSANLFSDLLLHDMGDELADDIVQGEADGDEFRTAPLWGLGKRIFFLHDGRTTDLLEAIRAHASNRSEANLVIAQFNRLSTRDQQDILNFLRSL
jgi:CxxC motif-containing protein (DUF1111 family)